MTTHSKIGKLPGAVIFTGDQKVDIARVHHLTYNKDSVIEEVFDQQVPDDIALSASKVVTWQDLRGMHDISLVEALGKQYSIHPMMVADIVDTQHRSVFIEDNDGIYLLLKSIVYDSSQEKIVSEHIALYFTKYFLLSFQEDHFDVFQTVRERLHAGKGIVRTMQADYLAFTLIDSILDNHFLVLDSLQEQVEELEDRIIEGDQKTTRQKIHFLKKEIVKLHRHLAPLREALYRMSRAESKFIEKKNIIYFRDLVEMVSQLLDRVENLREYINGLQDLLNAEISNRMNEVMKVLTVITTLFVPLSFLTGLYGMNFENMPELRAANGYFYLLAAMSIIVISLLVYFRRKKWL